MSDVMDVHQTIIVKGKVQGVYYRASAKQKANELNITGFAQNLPNGDVLIEAEGAEESLNEFTDWCRRGPASAIVSNVDISDGPVMDYLSFSIKR